MKKYLSFNGGQLKWIAIISMLFDHAAKTVGFYAIFGHGVAAESLGSWYPLYQQITDIFLILGRLAFPIFCFLIVEGFLHTSNVKRYAVRLFLFALVSEIPFDLAFFGNVLSFTGQNVFFTLFIGLITLAGLEKLKEIGKGNFFFNLLVIVAGMLTAELLHTDYGGRIGVLLIVVLYYFKDFPLVKCLVGALVILQNSYVGVLSFLLIYLYNGKRGHQPKYFFYAFYPVHLLLLVALQKFVVVPYFMNLFNP